MKENVLCDLNAKMKVSVHLQYIFTCSIKILNVNENVNKDGLKES